MQLDKKRFDNVHHEAQKCLLSLDILKDKEIYQKHLHEYKILKEREEYGKLLNKFSKHKGKHVHALDFGKS